METFEVLTPQLIDKIEAGDDDAQWVFLGEDENYPGLWKVDGLTDDYFFDFEEIIGRHGLLSPANLDVFVEVCKEGDYSPVFDDDPAKILDAYASLNDPPTVSVISGMAQANEQGFLPWQVAGFNKLIKSELPAGYVVWDTGTGKSQFICAALEYYAGQYDVALVAVKTHNRIETQRKIKKMTELDSFVIDGDIKHRYDIYDEIMEQLDLNAPIIIVTNYEKLLHDKEAFIEFVQKRRCLFFWDEMPTKLSNRGTKLYKATKEVLYESFYSKPRPKWMRHYALTATPVENSPGDVFSCVNLMQPGLLGTVTEFERQHVVSRNPWSHKPNAWRDLDLMEAKISHMTHRAVKEIGAEIDPMEKIIDWNPKHRALYDKMGGKAADLIEEFKDANVLALIQVMQMMCDAPSMIKESAQNRDRFIEMLEMEEDPDGPTGSEVAQTLISKFPLSSFTNVGHTKIETWHEIIDKHPDSKILTFSTWGSYIFPIWEELLTDWKIPYVLFAGTSKQKQIALDTFRDDPSKRVFLSSDAGADSIDIPQANVVVHYNLPWTWTKKKQRIGRADRVNSEFDWIYEYDLLMPNSVEERKRSIIGRKHGYHETLFDGKAFDDAIAATMGRDDLIRILTGD